jgi:hypothetical protein
MADKGTLSWPGNAGRTETRPINWTLDIRDHRGEPGFALLLIATNTHLSVTDLLLFLHSEGVGRSRTWVQRRRWLFQQAETVNSPGHKPNGDGKDARAVEIMLDNPKLSVRDLSRMLKENGINRSRDWCRRHRGG